MNPILEIYNLIFYQPVFWALLFFYKYLKDFGLVVVFLTFLIRMILFPLNYKSAKEQEKFLRIRKGIEEIEKKFNEERKIKEFLSLYKKEKINPFFNLFSFFIQFPILIALYQVFLKAPGQIDPSFFGFFNLSKPNFSLVLIAVILQSFYFKLASPKIEKEKKIPSLSLTQMNFFLILFTFLILLKLPSAISLYFISSYLFLIFQKILFHV
jgi:YidC/Oxa1 family membrane protein insertase